MQQTRFQKITLGIAGITAFSIGSFILFAPQAFYAGYGIAIANDANMLSELRAPGAGLAALGMIMLAGIMRPQATPFSVMAALVVYLGFPVGRIVGLIADGVPGGSVLGALAIELVIAGLCVAAFGRSKLKTRPGQRAAGMTG